MTAVGIIVRSMAHKAAFIDVVSAHTETLRGEAKSVPESWSVNKSEKRNLADWVLSNATAADLADFADLLDELALEVPKID